VDPTSGSNPATQSKVKSIEGELSRVEWSREERSRPSLTRTRPGPVRPEKSGGGCVGGSRGGEAAKPPPKGCNDK